MTDEFPNYPVHRGSSPKTALKILQADFGDGYTQRAADGLNHIQTTWEVQWDNIEKPAADEIELFIKAMGGYKAFMWTPPGDTYSRRWVCKQYSRTPTAGDELSSIKATFNEAFDL